MARARLIVDSEHLHELEACLAAMTGEQLTQSEVQANSEEDDALALVDALLAVVWDEIVDDYFQHKLEGLNPGDLIEMPEFQRCFSVALNNNGGEAEAEVLDVCTGTGWLLERLLVAHPGIKRALGIDISAEMIKKARTRFDGQKTRFIKGSISDHDFSKEGVESNSLELVISANGMDCVLEIEAALENIYRLIKPGGFFIFSIRHPERNNFYVTGETTNDNYPEGAYAETWDGTAGKPVVRFYRKETSWINLLRKAGFVNIQMITPIIGKSPENMIAEALEAAEPANEDEAQRIRQKVLEVIETYQDRPGAMIFMVRKPSDRASKPRSISDTTP